MSHFSYSFSQNNTCNDWNKVSINMGYTMYTLQDWFVFYGFFSILVWDETIKKGRNDIQCKFFNSTLQPTLLNPFERIQSTYWGNYLITISKGHGGLKVTINMKHVCITTAETIILPAHTFLGSPSNKTVTQTPLNCNSHGAVCGEKTSETVFIICASGHIGWAITD